MTEREPEDDVPASVPAAGDRRRFPAPAHLVFFHGPMDCGKSTLALQVDHNQSRQGRHGLLLSARGQRGGGDEKRDERSAPDERTLDGHRRRL